MTDGESGTKARTDIAALSAGVVAVAVSLFVSPGEYSVLNLVTSLTLIAVILAYVWRSERWWLQSLAVAMVIGFASVPGVGFFDEVVRMSLVDDSTQDRKWDSFLHLTGYYQWDCEKKGECTDRGEHKSRVPTGDVAIGWACITILTFATDRFLQRRRRQSGNSAAPQAA